MPMEDFNDVIIDPTDFSLVPSGSFDDMENSIMENFEESCELTVSFDDMEDAMMEEFIVDDNGEFVRPLRQEMDQVSQDSHVEDGCLQDNDSKPDVQKEKQ